MGGELTGMRQGRSAASGMLWTRRIDGVDLRAPEVKRTMLRSTGASSGRVRQCVAPRGRGGARGRGEGAREWLRPWWSSQVAAARFGEVGNSEGERTRGGEREQRVSERDQGGCVAPPGARSRAGEEAGGGARARARRHSSAYWQRLKTVGLLVGWPTVPGQWSGPATWAARWLRR